MYRSRITSYRLLAFGSPESEVARIALRVYLFCIVIVSNLYHCSYRSPMTHDGYNCDTFVIPTDTHRYAQGYTRIYPTRMLHEYTRYMYRHVSACIVKCITTRYRISVSSDTIFVSGVYQKRIVRSSASDMYQRKSRYVSDTPRYMPDTL